ncbi:gamma-glutamyltransferase [Leadbetterella byssophila DSM 17132]|uniref:Glutathione hydrolase proenzyme n=1 Tax=Leadbetterella byssophila (strain DSM 17132 / JCM 16389 / KACC 11308 / NBRC 106382 / 4M15) TaxID=649349 RepID=E4RU14_LEAB4|nr:gamma-glutamyltransferase [Leadbetterella byssophila]ADQ18722.1 gamma-glutamyltransferase [Leadbetterella byssophila DSM 17132]
MKKGIYFISTLILLWAGACKNAPKKEENKDLFTLFVEDNKPFYSDKKGVFAKNGMVASAHEEASKAGIEILQAGGNAIDAAIATHYALAVVFPFAGNLGGGGFAVIRKNNGEFHSIDFREKAPLAAHRDMYLDKDGNVIEGLSLKGHLASGVPGSVDGTVELHKKFGKLSWEKILEPAIRLAEKGVILTEREAKGLNNYRKTFLEVNGDDLQYFVKPDRSDWKTGELLVQKDLAECLKRIRDHKREGFYSGKTADLLVEEMKRGGGIISHEDLRQYKSAWRKPLEGQYRGYKVVSMAPSSSGGIALIQMLKLVEPYPLQEWGWNSEKTAQVMIEAERRVYADRSKWLGDTDFIKVPIDELLSSDYLKERWKDFNPEKASKSSEIEGGTIPGYESQETTHFSVVDKDGNAVSLTTTINGAYGSKVIVKGAGFLMNNEMDDFAIKAGVPNMFGLTGNKANEIAPGKRMLSCMSPTIIEKDGKLFMVVGTPGGSTIMTSIFQTILNVIDHKMSMQQSVNALKFHHQWLPDRTVYEKGAFSEKTLEALRKKGYVMDQQSGTLGRMDCILVYPDGRLEGASDPRADNTSVGY